MRPNSRIYVAGHRGMVGSAIVRKLRQEGFENLLLPGKAELDLRRSTQVDAYFQDQRPEFVFLAAAKVGGIQANNIYPADFIRDNLQIQTNVIDAAWRHACEKLLFLGSSCIYPKMAPQPLKEEFMLTGALEPTNEWYAIAKIAGLKMCQAYRRQYGFDAISLMPTNLYGPGDNFDLKSSHVLPALIRKFYSAKVNAQATVEIWGSGRPMREFLHVDDLASACLHFMKHYSDEIAVNIGWGQDVTIADLAATIAKVVGYDGGLEFDSSKPDGTPRKLLDTSKASQLGWSPTVQLEHGLMETFAWYKNNEASARI
ncbi:MAG: GDP-L-fucose synthase [Oceanococcus sp.]